MNAELNARTHLPHAATIVASGYAYPSDVVDNDTFFARCEFPIADDHAALARDARMRTRRWCRDTENTWTMARDAIDMALSDPGVDRAEIDVVLVSSCSTIPGVHYPDPTNPVVADLAPLVARHLGRDDLLCLDIKATYCAGFVRALQVMDTLLMNPNYRAGLIVASDVGGRFATAPTNRSAFCFIIGDAAGAVVVRKEAAGKPGIVDYVGTTVIGRGDLTAWGPDGRSVVVRGGRAAQATLEMLLADGRVLLRRNGLTAADVAWLLPMQTHAQAVDAVAEGLGFSSAQVLWRGGDTGYAASASIPAALAWHRHAGIVKPGDLVLSLAVGAGMNSGGALYRA
jgi:3-oxoacyl-[acyl-carrier-protein] synthase-3